MSARFGLALGGRFAPVFCRSFCGLRASCRGCRFSCLCSCLGWLGGCCRGGCFRGGWLFCFGGLLSFRFCPQFSRGPCPNDRTASPALIPRPVNHPPHLSLPFILSYIF